MRHRKLAKTAKLSGTLLPPAALVFYDPVESEQADGRRVRVHLDLEEAFLARCHGRSVIEAQRLQFAAEGDHLWGERTPKVSSVTTCVEAAKVGIQLALRGPNAGLVSNDQGSIDRGHCAPARGFGLDPTQNLLHTFQACAVAQTERRTLQADRSQPAGFSVPTQIHADEGVHDGWINSTASPTDMWPGVTT